MGTKMTSARFDHGVVQGSILRALDVAVRIPNDSHLAEPCPNEYLRMLDSQVEPGDVDMVDRHAVYLEREQVRVFTLERCEARAGRIRIVRRNVTGFRDDRDEFASCFETQSNKVCMAATISRTGRGVPPTTARHDAQQGDRNFRYDTHGMSFF
ncbi:MAG: hypothetical protein IID36_11025 [Planctomycetes bacterium]|nr:hypothetical protein [Planctomycetota bacterium]